LEAATPEQLAMLVEDSFVEAILTGRCDVPATMGIWCRRHDFEYFAKCVQVRSFAQATRQ
jgi:hypothetical protein